jgi:sulfoquinovosidase
MRLRRHAIFAAPLLLLFLACSDDEVIDPVTVAAAGGAGAAGASAAGGSAGGPGGAGGAGGAIPTSATLETGDVKVTLRLAPFGMQIASPGGKVVLDTIDPEQAVTGDDVGAYASLGANHRRTLIKPPLVVEGWDHTESEDLPWKHATKVTAATISGTKAEIDLVDPKDERLTAHVTVEVSGADVTFEAKVTGEPPMDPLEEDDMAPTINQMGLAFRLPPDEHFFGLGERFVTVDHRGVTYECWTEEGGIGAGEGKEPGLHNPNPNGISMTHVPIPFVVSSAGYGLYLESTFRSRWAFGSDDPSAWRLSAVEPHVKLHVFVHDDPKDTLADYTALTGRASLPAPWVFGPRRRSDRNRMVMGMREALAFRQFGVPTTAIDDATHFLPIGSQVGNEAELAQWTKDAHELGYKAIAYYNSYVSVTDERAKADAEEGRAKGYFVKDEEGNEVDVTMISAGLQTVATIDMTNPDAVDWYGTLLQRALDLGYDGWMLDFGEYLSPKSRMFDGRSGWEAHNAYPVLYQKATWDYMTKARGNDFLYFARAGGAGTQAFVPVVWSGDPSASFDDVKGLPATVRAGLTAGISGLPFWGSDISGYTCVNAPPVDKELYLRWAEFGSMSTDMHDEDACAQKDPDDPPKWTLWSDEETTKVYGDYARLHTRLFPYNYAMAKVSTSTGFPVMRHPVLLHPSEPEAWAAEFDYYYGDSLYVAPVVRRGQTTRDVWLPPGRWVDFWDLTPHAGGAHVTVNAPLAVLPMFVKSGQIVPLLDASIQTLAPEQRDDVISLDDVKGIFDVRAAIDPSAKTARFELEDGTRFDLALGAGDVTLGDVTQATTEAELATCDACGMIETLGTGVKRVRLTSAGGAIAAGALSATTTGTTTRVRWDVAVLPP